MNELSAISDFVKSVGFPVFVAVYLLVVHTPAINALTVAVTNLTTVVQSKK